MPSRSLGVHKTAMLTAVGQDAVTSCAALRAKIANPSPTPFMDADGDWILAHQVPLTTAEPGLERLASMALLVIEEALSGVPLAQRHEIPLLLCVAEKQRPGRPGGLDTALLARIQARLTSPFAPTSTVIAHGRVAVAVALAQARAMVHEKHIGKVLIVAVDSLLHWPTLAHYDRAFRLLRQTHSNGFMPGEGAGALLVGPPLKQGLVCTGLGFGLERAYIGSGEPLRADGLCAAIRAALGECGRVLHQFDFRITDTSGEQYYFKEATLALSRTAQARMEAFDIWHPAEGLGEAGAVIGAAIIAWADAACRKGYAVGPNILAHMSNDGGERAAVTLQFRGG